MKAPLTGTGIGLLLFSGCASTMVLSTWQDPRPPRVTLTKILVVAPSREASLRREAEDLLVHQLKRAEAVPSYPILPGTEISDAAALKAAARDARFDAVIIVRVVSVDRTHTWVPGSTGGTSYAFGGWPVTAPGQVRTETQVQVETNVYSLPARRLLWTSSSRTTNPVTVHRLVTVTARAVSAELRKDGLIE